jgi:predicted transcriptional regulator
MPTPKKDRTNTAIRFPDDIRRRLQQAAEDHDLSMNYLVVKAVEDFLDRLLDPSEVKLTRP